MHDTDSENQFPIGMGTGAVYVTLSGIKEHTRALTIVETIFYFINIALFLLNTTTLLLQAIRMFYSICDCFTVLSSTLLLLALVYPRQAWRLLKDPGKSIFAPLIVSINLDYGGFSFHFSSTGSLLCDYHHRYNQLWHTWRTHPRALDISSFLVCKHTIISSFCLNITAVQVLCRIGNSGLLPDADDMV
jgi:hypothetical protein